MLVNAKLSLSFPKRENESRMRYFPYINRLVKSPLNERKRTVQPRFPGVNGLLTLGFPCEFRNEKTDRERGINFQYINRLVKSPENRRVFALLRNEITEC